MKRHLTLAVLVVVAVSSSASAQTAAQLQRVDLFFQHLSVAGLLRDEAVQKELNLTDEQQKTLQEKIPALRLIEKGGYANLSREERKNRFDFTKLDEAIQTVLDEKQKKRLSELGLQDQGSSALLFPEVAKKLKLDEAQMDKLEKIERDSLATGQLYFPNASDEEFQKSLAEYRERREEMRKEFLGVLTDEQKAAFTKMQGKKFDFGYPRRRQEPSEQR